MGCNQGKCSGNEEEGPPQAADAQMLMVIKMLYAVVVADDDVTDYVDVTDDFTDTDLFMVMVLLVLWVPHCCC